MEGLSLVCGSCGTSNDGAARFCSNCGTLAGTATTGSRAAIHAAGCRAQGHHRPVLRRGRLDGAGGAPRSGGRRPDHVHVPRPSPEGHRGPRGGGREVHRRRRGRGLRGAVAHEDDPARAVRSALSILRDLAESASTSTFASASTRAKRSCAWVRSNARRRVRDGRQHEHRGPPPERRANRWRRGRRSHLPAHQASSNGRTSGRWRSRARRSRCRSGGLEAASPPPGRPAKKRHHSWVATPSWARCEGVRNRGTTSSQQIVTIVAEPGLGKSRIVRELRRGRRPPGRVQLAPGSMPSVRGRGRLLGARRGREIPRRDPRDGRSGDT